MQRGVKQALPELGPGKGAQTPRGVKRRDLILKVAATLFAENGFDSVSITDIGIAAGITGPAIYRYFASKETLLVSVYNHLYQRYSNGIKSILTEEISAWESLEMLVDLQITLALEEREKIRIVNSEERHLPTDEAANFRAENRRQLSVWTDLLGQARPDLPRNLCEVTVHAVLALVNSITLRRGETSSEASFRQHLQAMAMSTVSAGAANDSRNPQSA
jgi:AcrR family transcriptional regulator